MPINLQLFYDQYGKHCKEGQFHLFKKVNKDLILFHFFLLKSIDGTERYFGGDKDAATLTAFTVGTFN